MQIKRIKAHNYKTYLDLDLDLRVTDPQRPIILIGGGNGEGKTTLFEAIYGALYGLRIKNQQQFNELLNNGALQTEKPEITLSITFSGLVLTTEKEYQITRTYRLGLKNEPQESVTLFFDGDAFTYGPATPPSQRAESEAVVNKIIKANLPEELSRYFLYDAMNSKDLVDKEVFNQMIRENIENVMGFQKYKQLQMAAERVQQAKAKERLEAEQEAKDYEELCKEKANKEQEKMANDAEQDRIGKFLIAQKENYEQAKRGADEQQGIKLKIDELKEQLEDTHKRIGKYNESAKDLLQNLEQRTTLIRVVDAVKTEVEQMVRHKETLKKNHKLIPDEVIDALVKRVIDLLKSQQQCDANVNPDNIGSVLKTEQASLRGTDEYDFLSESDVMALKNMVENAYTNTFLQMSGSKNDLDKEILAMPDKKKELETYEKMLVKGKEGVIEEYEQNQRTLNELKSQEEEIKSQIANLQSRINLYDVRIQQEPDAKYDTLVKLVPFFSNVADALLQRKKTQIES